MGNEPKWKANAMLLLVIVLVDLALQQPVKPVIFITLIGCAVAMLYHRDKVK